MVLCGLKFHLGILLLLACFAECFGHEDLNFISRTFNSVPSIWLYSIVATVLVSAAPVLVILLIPDLKKRRSLLNILLAFAAGGLLGDAFLHLIPHSLEHDDHNHNHNNHDHDHEHEHHHSHSHDQSKNMIVGLWVVAGILSFLCVEKFVRLVKGGHNHGHNHSVDVAKQLPNPVSFGENSSASSKGGMEVRQRKSNDANKKKDSQSNKSSSSLQQHVQQTIKVSGYLNLVADFAHNFTDGLAIGASFLVNKNVGIVTTITILFHEVPHEIGDYAILIQSGCSRRKAILLQLVTAIGAMLGTVLSLIAQDVGTSSSWILPYTAGGFIYISTVSILPELIEGRSKLVQSVYEILAIVVGVGMMVAIAYFE